MIRHGRTPDDYDLERSHELERWLDRNEEREPSLYRVRRIQRRRRTSGTSPHSQALTTRPRQVAS